MFILSVVLTLKVYVLTCRLSMLFLPFQQACAPGQPRAESGQYQFVSALQKSLLVHLCQKDRKTCRGSVSALVQIHRKFLFRLAQPLCHRLYNPLIRLMQKKVFYLVRSDARFLQRFRSSWLVDAAFYGLRPASTALIAAALVEVCSMALVVPAALAQIGALRGAEVLTVFHWPAIVLAAAVFLLMNWRALKKVHPIVFIAASAVIGVALKM